MPDNTIVRFTQLDRIQGQVSIIDEVPTSDGVAVLDYVLEASTGPGQFRITAQAAEARLSQEVDIRIEEEAQVAIIIPTVESTATAEPEPSPTNVSTLAPSRTPESSTPVPLSTPSAATPLLAVELSEGQSLVGLIAGLIVVIGVAGVTRRSITNLQLRVSRALWGAIAAQLSFIYFITEMPGMTAVRALGAWAGLAATLVGGAVGLLAHASVLAARARVRS